MLIKVVSAFFHASIDRSMLTLSANLRATVLTLDSRAKNRF